jgi:hypothetical protein
VERRRVKDKFPGDSFYTRLLAPKVRNSDIDRWFEGLKRDKDGSEAIRIHKKLTDFLRSLTNLDKRSLASKYLHFHFPDQFFLYDSRASSSIKQLTPARDNQYISGNGDASYELFFRRCQKLSQHIKSKFGKALSPRELDDVLLYWDRKRRLQ